MCTPSKKRESYLLLRVKESESLGRVHCLQPETFACVGVRLSWQLCETSLAGLFVFCWRSTQRDAKGPENHGATLPCGLFLSSALCTKKNQFFSEDRFTLDFQEIQNKLSTKPAPHTYAFSMQRCRRTFSFKVADANSETFICCPRGGSATLRPAALPDWSLVSSPCLS